MTILHFGEILWDQFPGYKRPGGSPFNVMMHMHYLKHSSLLLSAVGRDEPGSELLDIISQKGAGKRFIRRADYPTGKVTVHMDEENEPSYTIHERVAWDFIEPPDGLEGISDSVDAFTFATLAQRSSSNRISLQRIMSQLPRECRFFLDVNLRPPFISKSIIEFSLKKADYVKMNRDEWKEIGKMFDISSEQDLLESYSLKGMALTLGGDGCVYFGSDGANYIETASEIAGDSGDFVGVGDAFWACFIHHTLKETPPQEALKKANRYAAWVAGQKGGIPGPDEDVIQSVV